LTNQPNLANQPPKSFESFAMQRPRKNVENSLKSLKIISHTVRTPRARTHQQQLACISGMHTVESSGMKLAQKIHALRARRARAGLTVYPPWIQIIDVFAASSQSCDGK
jgi:hypothetical protein